MSTCSRPKLALWCEMMRPPPLPPVEFAGYRELYDMMDASPEWQCYRDICNVTLSPPPTPLPSTVSTSANITTYTGTPSTGIYPYAEHSLQDSIVNLYLLGFTPGAEWFGVEIVPGTDQDVNSLLESHCNVSTEFTMFLSYRLPHELLSSIGALCIDEYQHTNYLHNKAAKKQPWKTDTAVTTTVDDPSKLHAMFQTQNNYVELQHAPNTTSIQDSEYPVKDNKGENITMVLPRRFKELPIDSEGLGTRNSDTAYDNANYTADNDKFGHSPGGDSVTPLFDDVDTANPNPSPTRDHDLQANLEAKQLPLLAAGSKEKPPKIGSNEHSKTKVQSSPKKRGHRRSKRISDPGASAMASPSDPDLAGRKRSV